MPDRWFPAAGWFVSGGKSNPYCLFDKPKHSSCSGLYGLMPYCVYVIENKSGRRYIGCSDNVQRRLAQHNSGISTWTRGKGPWRLVWIRANLSLSCARKMENLLKRQGRGLGFYKITGLSAPG